MYGSDRTQLRQVFFRAWQKKLNAAVLSELEHIIVHVIELHPEYHHYLENPDTSLQRDWSAQHGESNPFLHMGMHISIHEQLGADQPPGIKLLYQRLLNKYHQPHEVEHRMIDCLGLVMWQSQTSQTEPDLQQYRECLEKLL